MTKMVMGKGGQIIPKTKKIKKWLWLVECEPAMMTYLTSKKHDCAISAHKEAFYGNSQFCVHPINAIKCDNTEEEFEVEI